MNNYYKYLPVSKEDESWGLAVHNVGCTRVEAGAAYPVKGHPAHHYFKWPHWRHLPEYQLIYITHGQGTFESRSAGEFAVKAGTIIVLFPNEPHRYQPDPATGWDEYWVGLRGAMIDNLLDAGYIEINAPCNYIGFKETILELFNLIVEKSKAESIGYQPLIAGAVMFLLGQMHVALKQQATPGDKYEMVISKAMLQFRANISNAYSAQQAAMELNVGYSWFRRAFKNYTGLSPGQYYLQLKIEKAKELLHSSISVKEIAITLNLESVFYFSRIFKEKTGFSPTEYRKRVGRPDH